MSHSLEDSNSNSTVVVDVSESANSDVDFTVENIANNEVDAVGNETESNSNSNDSIDNLVVTAVDEDARIGDNDASTSSISSKSRGKHRRRKAKFRRYDRRGKITKVGKLKQEKKKFLKVDADEKKHLEQCKQATGSERLSSVAKSEALECRSSIEKLSPTRKLPRRIPKSVAVANDAKSEEDVSTLTAQSNKALKQSNSNLKKEIKKLREANVEKDNKSKCLQKGFPAVSWNVTFLNPVWRDNGWVFSEPPGMPQVIA